MKNKISLLIPTCNKFSDVLPGCVESVKRFWPDFNNEIFTVTDLEPENRVPGITYFVAGDIAYSDRLKYALERMESEYLIICLDDYYINKLVDDKHLDELFEIVKNNNIDYLRLFTKSWPETEVFDETNDLLKIDLSYHRYKVNLYIGIWKRETMIKVLDEPLNPWQLEVSLTAKMEKLNANCITLGKKEVIEIADVVRKGRITRDTWKYVKKNGLYNGNRKKQSLYDFNRLKLRNWYKNHASKKSQDRMKRFLKKLGFKFYSDWDE